MATIQDSVPDFPGSFQEDLGGSAAGVLPLLDEQETSEQTHDAYSYRTFATSGCRHQVLRAREIYAALTDSKAGKRLASYDACRSAAWFVRNRETGKIKVASSRCGNRWCPLCIRTRRYIITSAVSAWLKKQNQPKFLTLTLKHTTAPITQQINHLYNSFKKLKRLNWFKKRLKGGIWFFQVKKSETDNLWHPHLHILFAGKYLPHADVSEIWSKITHGSKIVDVRAVKNPQKAAEYVARYAAAPCELSDLDFDGALAVVTALHGRRIVGTFGSGNDIALSPKKTEDIKNWEWIGNFNRTLKGSKENMIDAEIVACWKSGEPCTIMPAKPPPEPEIIAQITKQEPETYRQLKLF